MRAVKSRDTGPEIAVRQLLRSIGKTGYRLHRNDLQGKPDIAFVGRKLAIFVHGCFWHGHDCRAGARTPKTNLNYWLQKIERNKQRDIITTSILSSQGWRILIVWECEIKQLARLKERLLDFLGK